MGQVAQSASMCIAMSVWRDPQERQDSVGGPGCRVCRTGSRRWPKAFADRPARARGHRQLLGGGPDPRGVRITGGGSQPRHRDQQPARRRTQIHASRYTLRRSAGGRNGRRVQICSEPRAAPGRLPWSCRGRSASPSTPACGRSGSWTQRSQFRGELVSAADRQRRVHHLKQMKRGVVPRIALVPGERERRA
jgi:hypothetical protein